jgi:hypothetical protein
VGILAGTMFVNVFCIGEYDKFGVYGQYFVNKFENTEIGKSQLFFYSFWNRSKEIGLLFLFAFTSFGAFFPEVYLMYKGLTISTLIAVYVVQYGMGGILIFLLGIFPHYITYILLVIVLVGVCKKIYLDFKEVRTSRQRYKPEKQKILLYVKYLLLIVALNMITSYLEVFVNLRIIKNIMK